MSSFRLDSSSGGGAGRIKNNNGGSVSNQHFAGTNETGPDRPGPAARFFGALVRKKPLDGRTETNLNRCLNLLDLVTLGVGSTLGLGLYVLAGQVASNKAGPAVVLSFALAALASAFSALCYAEFAGRVPRAGSAYAYSYITVGEFVAFIIGWNLILEYVIGASSVARGFSGYLRFVYQHVIQNIFANSQQSAPELTSGEQSSNTTTIIDHANLNGIRSSSNLSRSPSLIIASNHNNTGTASSAILELAKGFPENVTTTSASLVAVASNFNSTLLSPATNTGLDLGLNVTSTLTESTIDYLVRYFDWPSIAIVVVLTIFILFGVKESTNVTLSFTAVNMIVVVTVVISSLRSLDIHNWQLSKEELPIGANYGEGGFMPYGWSGVLAGSATCFFGFIGFDTIASSAEEAKNPKRNVPLAIVLSLFISFVAYMAIAIVQTLLWPYYDQDNVTILPYIFGRLNMPITYWIVLLGAVAGLASSQLGGMYPLPRILYSMAQDKLIYAQLAHVNKRLRLPVRATIVGSIFIAALACLLDIQDLADMVSIGTLAAYSLVSLSVLIVRYENRHDAIDDSTLLNRRMSFTDIIALAGANSGGLEKESELSSAPRSSVGAGSDAESTSDSAGKLVKYSVTAKLSKLEDFKVAKTKPDDAGALKEACRSTVATTITDGSQHNKSNDIMSDKFVVKLHESKKSRSKRQFENLLDLLITWNPSDGVTKYEPDDATCRQSKILIAAIVVLTIVLDVVAFGLTSADMMQPKTATLSASDQQPMGLVRIIAEQQYLNPKSVLIAGGCIVLVALAAAILMLSRLPVSKPAHPDMFLVPFVPLIPILSIFVNTFLMLNLSYLTWVRFIIWMTMGFFIYFTYGIWNSQGHFLHINS